MSMMLVCERPPRAATLLVPERPTPPAPPVTPVDPETVHVCVVCDHLDHEESTTFDMSHCDSVGGWIDRDCHHTIACRDPLCDPHHI